MERDVRYCTTDDGVRIAYSVQGEGPILVVCPFFFESFASDNLVPEFAGLMDSLGNGRTLIRYDQRGAGLSHPAPADLSVNGQTLDILAVARSIGDQGFTLLAGTLAGQRAITFAATHPDLLNSLILYGTFARPTDVMSWENLQALTMLSRANGQVASQTFADMAGRQELPSTLSRFAEWCRQSASGDVVADTLEASFSTDATDLLSRVTCPTLILHRQYDSIFPFRNGQSMASAIPNARLVPLPGAGHSIALGETEPILRAIDTFWEDVVGSAHNA